MAPDLRPVRDATDREYACDLLDSHGLPTADLDAVELFVLEIDGNRVGVGGLKVHGEAVLLRPVAVEPAARGEGHGLAMVEGLGKRARDRGVDRAYLLTTTAAGFFRALGFETVEREAVPEPIRATDQFRELCPASATYMERDLDRDGQ